MLDNNIKDDRGYNQTWSDCPSTRIRFERRCDLIASQMRMNPDENILEIGCGTGSMSFRLAEKTNKRVLGTDLCAPFIEHAKNRYSHPKLTYHVLNFNEIESLNNQKFEYIVGNGILHHLYQNLDSALINMRKLLKENGKIIFWEPNLKNPFIYLIFSFETFRKKAHLEPDEMAFTKRFIENKLNTAGYSNVKVSERDFLLPGVPEFAVNPLIKVGDILENVFFLRSLSQSLFIEANF